MDINMMTARNVLDGINKHMSIEDFCEKYECSEEDFDRRLSVLYKHQADAKKREIIAAAKKGNKGGRKKKVNAPESIPLIPLASGLGAASGTTMSTQGPIMTNKLSDILDDFIADTRKNFIPPLVPRYHDTSATDLPDNICPCGPSNEEMSLEELSLEEKKLQDEVINLEGKQKNNYEKRSDYNLKLGNLRTKIDKIIAELSELEAQHTELANEFSQLIDEADDISVFLTIKNDDLAKIRKKIAEKKKIYLGISNDGKISPVDNNIIFEYNDDGYLEKLIDFADKDFIGCLSVYQATALAKLLVIREQFNDVEFIFDDPVMEEAFKKLI